MKNLIDVLVYIDILKFSSGHSFNFRIHLNHEKHIEYRGEFKRI